MRTRSRSSLAPFASLRLAARAAAALAVLALATLATVGGCSNQGEGGVCDPNSDDCSGNLTCLHLPAYGYRCCPPMNTPSTTHICGGTKQSGVADANVPPADSGSSSSSGGDAEAGSSAADATSADAPNDTSSNGSRDGAEGGEGGTSPAAEASDGPVE
jgi:hypothetical protein